MSQLEKFVAPADVASALDVDVKTIYRLVDKGELPALKFGRLVRIPQRAVIQWCRDHMRPQQHGGPR